jgi:hypothetical protein
MNFAIEGGIYRKMGQLMKKCSETVKVLSDNIIQYQPVNSMKVKALFTIPFGKKILI